MNERERIEREAWEVTSQVIQLGGPPFETCVSMVTALVLRERAAAFESATKAIEGLPRFHLMRDTDSGCCHASMLGVTDDGPWISRSDAIDALAVQERAQ